MNFQWLATFSCKRNFTAVTMELKVTYLKGNFSKRMPDQEDYNEKLHTYKHTFS